MGISATTGSKEESFIEIVSPGPGREERSDIHQWLSRRRWECSRVVGRFCGEILRTIYDQNRLENHPQFRWLGNFAKLVLFFWLFSCIL